MKGRARRSAGDVVGVVLAAGASRRSGGVKGLATLGGEPLVVLAVRCLREGGCGSVVVVVGPPHGGRVAAVVAGAVLVHNPEPERGMSTSLCLGLGAAAERRAGAAMISLVDHPRVRPSTVEALISAWMQGDARLVRPCVDGRRGHPFLVDSSLFASLRALPEGASPRALLRAAVPQRCVDVDDAGVLEDLDTAAQLAAAGLGRPPRRRASNGWKP